MSTTLPRPVVRRTTLLAASVALNVFLLGLIGSHFVLARDPAGNAADARYGPFRHVLAALPPDDADRFRAVLDRERPSYQPAQQAVSTAHHAVAEAIGSAPYDAALVRDALQRWQASWLTFSGRFNDTFLDAVGALSDAGRAKLRDVSVADEQKRRAGE